MYVGGLSGVGFDTKGEIEESERVFRALGLPGFITDMDAVHMAYDRAPFPARHLFIGKEGYPTAGVNMYSSAVGWVKPICWRRLGANKSCGVISQLISQLSWY
jgi:hypothetical protein